MLYLSHPAFLFGLQGLSSYPYACLMMRSLLTETLFSPNKEFWMKHFFSPFLPIVLLYWVWNSEENHPVVVWICLAHRKWDYQEAWPYWKAVALLEEVCHCGDGLWGCLLCLSFAQWGRKPLSGCLTSRCRTLGFSSTKAAFIMPCFPPWW